MKENYSVDKDGNAIFPEGIKKIDSDAFRECRELKNVVIPNGVSEIGKNAFSFCYSLENIVIPDSVQKIGDMAFAASKIKNLIIPNSVKSIGKESFSCTPIENIVLSEKITKIEDGLFRGCSKLKKIDIPTGVTKIGKEAFSGCSLIQSVAIPESVIEICDYAFYECSSLEKIVIPESVTKIYQNTFRKCKIENFESNLLHIKNSCILADFGKILLGCANNSVKEIKIPDGVTKIEKKAFAFCDSLEKVVLPESVVEIEKKAFERCPKLVDVRLGSNIKKISSLSFSRSPNVSLTTLEGSVTENTIVKNEVLEKFYHAKEFEKKKKIKQIKTVGKQGLLNSYCENIGKKFDIKLNKKIIEVTIFENDDDFVKIYVPEKTSESKLKEIQVTSEILHSEIQAALENNVTVKKMEEVFIKNLKSFEWESFSQGTKSLYIFNFSEYKHSLYKSFNRLILSHKKKEIFPYQFYHYDALECVVIPETVERICDGAFKKCSLKEIYFEGTKAQWNEIVENSEEGKQSYSIKVKCSDGELNGF